MGPTVHERSGRFTFNAVTAKGTRPINDRTRIDLGCFDATKKTRSFDIRGRNYINRTRKSINSLIGVIEISCIKSRQSGSSIQSLKEEIQLQTKSIGTYRHISTARGKIAKVCSTFI